MGTMFRRWERHCHPYVPELNDISIEDNYAEISKEEIKDAYLKYGKQRKPHKKKVKRLHMLHSVYNLVPKFLL